MKADNVSHSIVPTPPMAPTASRASWIGTLKVGELSVPAKAFAAIVSDTNSQLRQVHAGCGKRLAYQKTCPIHGNLEASEIAKAYPYSPDRLVEFSEGELRKLLPADDKTLVLERFFEPQRLNLILLAGRSLYLVPANAAAHEPFAVVMEALSRKKRWALGRVVFSSRRQLVVVRADGAQMILHTLHNPDQQRACTPVDFSQNGRPRPSVRALTMLMDGASGPIPWSEYHDDTDQQLAALVRQKISPSSNGRSKKPPVRVVSNGRSNGTTRRRRKAA